MAKFVIKTNLSAEVRKAIGDIDRYDSDTQQRLRNAVEKGTKDTYQEAVKHVHTRTGNLLKKMSMQYDSRRNTGIVKSKAHHSWLVEHGASATIALPKRRRAMKYDGNFFKIARIPKRQAHPFMKPAIDTTAPKIEQAVQEAVDHD